MIDANDSLSQYFKNINDVVSSSSGREELHDLWKRAKRGDRRAKKRILELNMRLVIPIARKYSNHGVELMDLIEEGNLGLLHAIDKFDPRKGYRFSTYATYWITQHIRRAVEEQSGTIRIPAHAWESLRHWLRQWDAMHGQLGRDPTLSEMAAKMHWSARQVKAVMEAAEATKGMGSLGMPVGEDEDLTLEDMIQDKEHHSPDSVISNMRMRDDFSNALKQIGDRERMILELRYGLTGKKPMTLEEIGKKLKLSRERVRQVEERAVLRLRRVAQRAGMIDAGDLKKQGAPNYHQGKVVIPHGQTDILGKPIGKNPLKAVFSRQQPPAAGKGKKRNDRRH